MKTFKRFLEENPNFYYDITGDREYDYTIFGDDGRILFRQDDIYDAIVSYYAYYYVNRDYEEMVHYFQLQTKKFMRDGFEKLFELYDDMDVKNAFFSFLRDSKNDNKSWTRNRPISIVDSDETSATMVNGAINTLVDKGYTKNQVEQFKNLVRDFYNIYKAYINSFGYIFCEVW